MVRENKNITEVEIYRELYKIVNNAPPEYTQALARYVDEKMKEVSQSTSTVSSTKIAVLAALNIADELFKIKKELNTEKKIIVKETDHLYRLIHDNLSS